jgi:hypothetical protein
VTPLIGAAGVGNAAVTKRYSSTASMRTRMLREKARRRLMGAAHNGDAELTRVLVRKPMSTPRPRTTMGIVKNGPVVFGAFTALHLARLTRALRVVKLLDSGASVDPRDARIDPAHVETRLSRSRPTRREEGPYLHLPNVQITLPR